MFRILDRRKIAALFLILILAAPWAAEAQFRAPADLVLRLLDPFEELVAKLWSKAGGSADPNGAHASQPASTWLKNGGSADPDGTPTSQPRTTGTAPTSDNGGSLDPNG